MGALQDRHAIEAYATELAADAIRSVAQDDLNEDGDISDALHPEAMALANGIARAIEMWPGEILNIAREAMRA